MTKFTTAEDDYLVEGVRKHPLLYDHTHEKHKDLILKEHVWGSISIKVGRSVGDCKKRWKNIRDVYMRYRRSLSSGSLKAVKTRWSLIPHLTFLNVVDNEKNTTPSDYQKIETEIQLKPTDELMPSEPDSDDSYAPDEVLQNIPTCSLPKKRSRGKYGKVTTIFNGRAKGRSNAMQKIQDQNDFSIKNSTRRSLDEVDLFCQSLAMSIKKLPPRGINEAKLKLLHTVNELEEKYLYTETT